MIWFSCFCWASAILSVMLSFWASLLETEVSAARHPAWNRFARKPTVRPAANALVAINGVSAMTAVVRLWGEILHESHAKLVSLPVL